MIDCIQVESLLYEYLDNELDKTSMEQFEKHIELCRVCFSHVEFERKLRSHLQNKTNHMCPARVKERIQQLILKF